MQNHDEIGRTESTDMTGHRRVDDLLQVRLTLMEYAAGHSLEDVLQKTLDEIGDMVGSPIGFYHFVEPDQKHLTLQVWSTRTVREFCTAQRQGMHYSIDEAGVWVDCVHQRRPIIHNNFESVPNRKGMPEGHARLIREMVVPIFRGGKIVAILGVGNKPADYTEKDVELVTYFADVAWEIAERKQAEEALRLSEEKFRLLAEQSITGTCVIQDGGFLYVNPRLAEILDFTPEEMIRRQVLELVAEQDRDMVQENMRKRISGEVATMHYIFLALKKDGSEVTMEVFGSSLVYKGRPAIIATLLDITERRQAEE
ncbi:MAG: GAF domain-containing protein, partial [Nitrospirota bacterium]